MSGSASVGGVHFGDYKAGFRFGQARLRSGREARAEAFQGTEPIFEFADRILPWAQHVRPSRDLLRRAFDSAQEVGDLTYAAYSRNVLVTNLLAAGDPLAEVQREAEAPWNS